MSKKFKRILSLVMAAVMLLCSGTVAGVSAIEADDVLSYGSCGRNVKYIVYSNGEMVIGGNGAMYDYTHNADDLPWNDFSSEIHSVIIEDGVTSIGNHAFWWLNNMHYLYIPESVERVGVCAMNFYGGEYNEVIYAGSEEEWENIEFVPQLQNPATDFEKECANYFDINDVYIGFNGENYGYSGEPAYYFEGRDPVPVKYGDILVLTVYSETVIPEGASFYWEAEGYGVELEYNEYDERFYIRANDTGSVDINIGIEYEDGSIHYSDHICIETRSSFFLIIISIIKDLFGVDRYVY